VAFRFTAAARLSPKDECPFEGFSSVSTGLRHDLLLHLRDHAQKVHAPVLIDTTLGRRLCEPCPRAGLMLTLPTAKACKQGVGLVDLARASLPPKMHSGGDQGVAWPA